MRNVTPLSLARLFTLACAFVFSAGAHGAVTDIASAPVITSAGNVTPIPPNLMFVLDDSGSMEWDYLPDWSNENYCKRWNGAAWPDRDGSRCCRNQASNSSRPCMYQNPDPGDAFWIGYRDTGANARRMDVPMTSSDFNFAYYNPAIRYQPPRNADGTSRPSLSCANSGGTVSGADCTNGWQAVKLDAYGIQALTTGTINLRTQYPDVEWCTDDNFGTCRKNTNYFYPTQLFQTFRGVEGKPFYYNIVAGEYCSDDKLTTCVAATGPSASYPFAAKVRWCSDVARTACQGIKNATYRYPRYPTITASHDDPANIAVTFAVSGPTGTATARAATVISPATGPALLTAATATDTTVIGLTQKILNNIGNGYVASPMTCTDSGSTRTCTFTVLAPASGTCPSGAFTLTLSGSGSLALTVLGSNNDQTRFSGHCRVPGAFQRVDIDPANNSYPKSSARSDCTGATCTYLEEMENFANWFTYYRTRMQMMKTSTSLAFSSIGDTFRVGYMSINNNTRNNTTNPGDFLNITTFDTNQKLAWYNKLFAAFPNSSTPLRSALSTAGLIYGGVLNGTTFNGSTVTDPVLYSCQSNYTLLSTDGYWNTGNDSGCSGQGGIGCKLDRTSDVGNTDGGAGRPYSDGFVTTVTTETPIVTTTVVTTPVDAVQPQTRNEWVVTPQTRTATVNYNTTNARIVSNTACTGTQAGKRRIAFLTVSPNPGSVTQTRSVTTTIPQSRTATTPSSQVKTTTRTVTRTVITTNGVVTSQTDSPPVDNVNTVTTASGTPSYSAPTSGTPSPDNPLWTTGTLPTPTYSAGALSGSNNNAGCSSAAAGTVLQAPTTAVGAPYGTPLGGTPTSDTFSAWTNIGAATNTPTGSDQTTVTGPTEGTPTITSNSTGGVSDSLADVAYYYYSTDLRAAGSTNPTTNRDVGTGEDSSGTDAIQRMNTYTLGLGIDGYMKFRSDYETANTGDYQDILNGATSSASKCTWQGSNTTCNWPAPSSDSQANIDDLWHAAVNGRGEYFSARSPAELAAGIGSALNSINAKNGAAAAATTSNPNITSGDNFLFSSDYRSKDWFSRLQRLQIDPATGNIVTVLDVATGLQVPKVDWEAGALLDAVVNPPGAGQGTRKILTFGTAAATCAGGYPTGSTGSNLKAFCWESLTTSEQNYFQGTAIASLPQFCVTGTYAIPGDPTVRTCLDSTQQTSASGAALIDFLRGDPSREDQTGNTYRFYRDRLHVLGDIISSEAVYVKTPLADYPEVPFQDFKVDQTAQVGMVYVAANDGMLHAFNAETGAEVWAYVPTMTMPKMFNLASMNYGNDHRFMLDGTPVVGYAYIGPPPYSGFSSTLKDNWRTMLVGGLGAAGAGFYALDITDPANPVGMWEFRKATTCAANPVGQTSDCDLGVSMGNPVVAKLIDGTWVVLVTSGYNNTTPGNGQGYLYVLNAKTGAIINKIGTGVGSNSAISGVCTTAPCPSGLSKIAGWVDNPQSDPTVKRVYGGDLFGNLWRFDVNNNIGAAGYDAQLLTVLKGPTGARQPVTMRPELGVANGAALVLVGTGRLLGDSDRSSADQTGGNKQSFYGIKDPLTATGWVDTRQTGSAGVSMQTVTVDGATGNRTIVPLAGFDLATQQGWGVDLPANGELANTDPTLVLGTLVFTTNLPEGSACSSAGESFIYNLDYRSGGQIEGGPAGTKLANALATRPVVVQLPSGAVRSITRLSDTRTDVRDVKIGGGSTNPRRVSWRQLINE